MPGHASRDIVDRLVEGGIRGIVNFSSVPLHATYKEKVYVSNFDIVGRVQVFVSAVYHGTALKIEALKTELRNS